jgi:hypothetical protein
VPYPLEKNFFRPAAGEEGFLYSPPFFFLRPQDYDALCSLRLNASGHRVPRSPAIFLSALPSAELRGEPPGNRTVVPVVRAADTRAPRCSQSHLTYQLPPRQTRFAPEALHVSFRSDFRRMSSKPIPSPFPNIPLMSYRPQVRTLFLSQQRGFCFPLLTLYQA